MLPLLFFVFCSAEVHEGMVQGVSSWRFMHRFCFMPSRNDQTGNSGKGKFEYKVTYPKASNLSLLLYYNDFGNWHSVYGSTMTCLERINMASTHRYLSDGQIVKGTENKSHVTRHQYFWFETRRARYFFVALANCRLECKGIKPNCAVE